VGGPRIHYLNRLPIRVRITAAFALAMVLVIAAAGLFVYLRMEKNLSESIDNGLSSRSDDVSTLVQQSGAGLSREGGGRLGDREDSFVQVLRPDGRFMEGTTAVRRSALRPDEVQRALQGPAFFEHDVPGVEGTARILARPVGAERGFLLVVTGASLQDRAEALHGLLVSFLIGGAIAVVVSSGIAYLLAAASFVPVEAMRRRAEQISLSRGGERLPLPAAQDEIHRLGDTLNEMLARLEVSFEQERRFVADAGHELRTPLAVLKAELETALRTGGDNEAARESLVAALEETDHLAQLADDLLLIAQAADGHLPIRREHVDVRELLERTRQRFTDRAHQHGREIRVDAPSDLSVSIDPLRGRQALGNLVDNALRHGGGEIRLSARRDDDAVEITVSDSGSGFPPELALVAFERFSRGDGGRTIGGAGLGLAIVRAIAEAHGGSAAIAANGSPGATVKLRVPVRVAADY
jgi:two-component system, OmpR family, sensor kinase